MYGFPGPSAHVAVFGIGSFDIVVDEPGVEVGLQRLDAGMKCLVYLRSEELVQYGAVEMLDKAVGARRANASLAMLDAGQGEVEFERVGGGAVELATVVGQDGTNLEPDTS
jgi:hypothetical protein